MYFRVHWLILASKDLTPQPSSSSSSPRLDPSSPPHSSAASPWSSRYTAFWVVPPRCCLNADISNVSTLSSHSTTTLPLLANGARVPSTAAKTAPPLCHSEASLPCCIYSNILFVPVSLNIVIYCQISLPHICPYTFDYCIKIGGHLFWWSNWLVVQFLFVEFEFVREVRL